VSYIGETSHLCRRGRLEIACRAGDAFCNNLADLGVEAEAGSLRSSLHSERGRFDEVWPMSTVPRDKGGVEIDRCRAVVTDACARSTHPSGRVLRRKNCMSTGEARASDEPTTTTWSLQSGERWSTGCSRFNPTTCVGVVAGRRKRGNRQLMGCTAPSALCGALHCCKSRSTYSA
jgi:hypothetical protein